MRATVERDAPIKPARSSCDSSIGMVMLLSPFTPARAARSRRMRDSRTMGRSNRALTCWSAAWTRGIISVIESAGDASVVGEQVSELIPAEQKGMALRKRDDRFGVTASEDCFTTEEVPRSVDAQHNLGADRCSKGCLKAESAPRPGSRAGQPSFRPPQLTRLRHGRLDTARCFPAIHPLPYDARHAGPRRGRRARGPCLPAFLGHPLAPLHCPGVRAEIARPAGRRAEIVPPLPNVLQVRLGQITAIG